MEQEATPLRRLVAFALVFFGLFMMVNGNFVGGYVLLPPPLLLVFVLLAGSAGIAIWVNERVARGLLHIGAAVAVFTSAAVWALLNLPADWATLLVVLLGADGLIGWGLSGVHLIRPVAWYADFDRVVRLGAGIATFLLVLFVWPGGGGPVLAIVTGLTFLLVAWMLRPLKLTEEIP